MNLDKMIRYKLLELSKKYEISIVDILKPVKKGRNKIVSRVISVNYRPKGTSPIENEHVTFFNKRDLVSWLICLK